MKKESKLEEENIECCIVAVESMKLVVKLSEMYLGWEYSALYQVANGKSRSMSKCFSEPFSVADREICTQKGMQLTISWAHLLVLSALVQPLVQSPPLRADKKAQNY